MEQGSSLDEALQAEVRLPPGSEGESINLFAALDTDLDARLSESEFFVEWHKQATKEIFESEDTDKNGFLEWTEFGGPKVRALCDIAGGLLVADGCTDCRHAWKNAVASFGAALLLVVKRLCPIIF